ncbi:DUF354 domain-containing protein [Cyclobacterium sp. 1_MG-2023]|uniref:DUF354 domain-containing protein n=1 Tax=Cyclobacterium sp. 1_MG-2023 TaxID=3062681 RepID=UPI0026E311E8|nr:DUF354 domain-containing protein [Cyclobacterium sp. 1_MG-2023]MDO6440473.1 DUF354 domain-containing protein [Cyclobacterium sp. 1_MG-2023]
MKILIDIKHPAQLNLFKGLAKELVSLGWTVIICYLDRGKLPKIIDREYSEFNRIKVGSSKGTKWSIFWNGNVLRTTSFLQIIRKEKFNICISASSAPLALACKLTGTPLLQFYDDPERKAINKINAKLSTKIFFPPIVKENKQVEIFDCLKEWSYLSPSYFKPDETVLEKYGLKPNEYVFVREVSNKSFNYYNQEDAIICSFSDQINKNIPVLLSLEDKSIKDKFPNNWTILEEPIADIHSLIYFSKLMVSSGDSMAREGAMLGIPSIYCGIREMKANQLLIDKGILEHCPVEEAVKPFNDYISAEFDQEKQIKIRENLLKEWDDMNQFMMSQILKYKK